MDDVIMPIGAAPVTLILGDAGKSHRDCPHTKSADRSDAKGAAHIEPLRSQIAAL
ncbi:MAG: hypothetical protein AAGH68_16465 [Pseudomonadota bacterium]